MPKGKITAADLGVPRGPALRLTTTPEEADAITPQIADAITSKRDTKLWRFSVHGIDPALQRWVRYRKADTGEEIGAIVTQALEMLKAHVEKVGGKIYG